MVQKINKSIREMWKQWQYLTHTQYQYNQNTSALYSRDNFCMRSEGRHFPTARDFDNLRLFIKGYFRILGIQRKNNFPKAKFRSRTFTCLFQDITLSHCNVPTVTPYSWALGYPFSIFTLLNLFTFSPFLYSEVLLLKALLNSLSQDMFSLRLSWWKEYYKVAEIKTGFWIWLTYLAEGVQTLVKAKHCRNIVKWLLSSSPAVLKLSLVEISEITLQNEATMNWGRYEWHSMPKIDKIFILLVMSWVPEDPQELRTSVKGKIQILTKSRSSGSSIELI